jgi:fatty acid desaturase
MHRNSKLIAETISVFLFISLLAVWVQGLALPAVWKGLLYGPLLLFQGFWFYRFYIVGHEAAHKKLFADKPAPGMTFGAASSCCH